MKTKTTMETTGAGAPVEASPEWPFLARWSAVALTITMALAMVAMGEVIPPLIAFGVIFIAAAMFTGRKPRVGAMILTFLFAALVLLNLPFIVPSLAVPASTVDFLMTTVSLTLSAMGLVAAIATIRRRPGSSGTPRKVALTGAGLIVISIAVAVVAGFTYSDAVAQPGDVALTAENFEFSDTTIESRSGTVAVLVTNNDTALHTFTVKGLDVDLQVPAGRTARVEFTAEPGSYEFICVPHEADMKGTLQIR